MGILSIRRLFPIPAKPNRSNPAGRGDPTAATIGCTG
jgi:hypothetical protein